MMKIAILKKGYGEEEGKMSIAEIKEHGNRKGVSEVWNGKED
jgi:hypothetical protein